MGGDQKGTVNKNEVVMCRFRSAPSPVMRISTDLESFFSSWYREGDTHTNRDFLHKRVFYKSVNFYSIFKAFLSFPFLKNNQCKIILCRRDIFWGPILFSPAPDTMLGLCWGLKIHLLNE